MKEAWIGVVGIALGAFLTGVGAWYGSFISTRSNEKIANINYDLEMIKLQRDHDLERLNYLLKPIIFGYMESDQLRSYYCNTEVELFGKGLHDEFVNSISSIIENNMMLVSFEIQRKYLTANGPDNMMKFSQEKELASIRDYERLTGKGNASDIKDFSFDDDRQFINLIKKEAREIERKYN